MNNFSKLFLSFFALATLAFSQALTTSTTTTQAMGRNDGVIFLTSATGVSAASMGSITGGYIDREYITFTSLASGTLGWNVKRGVAGIQSAHASGVSVWIGPPSVFDQGPFDRVGACTATTFARLPLVMVRSGEVTHCTSTGKYGNFTDNRQVGSVLASQAGAMSGAFQITAAVTHVSGTAAITSFAIPPGLPDGGNFVTIPDGAFTWTAAGNLVSTGTAVAGKAITWTYDRALAKLYPSY